MDKSKVVSKGQRISANTKAEEHKVSEKIKHYLKRIRLRHIAFGLVALAGIALTTATIVILWRLTSVRIVDNEVSDTDYIGAIGVLVAFVAAFLGLLVTIMFGNYIYNNIDVKRKLQEINKQSKHISDLYVVALRAEANNAKIEKNYLRAVERWLGVIFYFLKTPYNFNTDTFNLFFQSVRECIKKLDYNGIMEYYKTEEYSEAGKIDSEIDNSHVRKEINDKIEKGLLDISNKFELILKQSKALRFSYQIENIKSQFLDKKTIIENEMKL